MRIALIVSDFNKDISDQLLKGALRRLKKEKKAAFEIFRVPGAFEIPFMAQKLIDSKKYNGIIALGCVIKGKTDHYKAVCDGVTYGIQKVSIENRFPIMFGVLMCRTKKQAMARHDKGYECVKGLLEILKDPNQL